MAQIPPERTDDEVQDLAADRRRRAVRYGAPLAVAGLAAATIGLMPALAQGDGADADISAEELIAKVFAADAQTVDGTVKVSADLGLPALAGGAASGGPGGQLSELLSGDTVLEVAADGPDRQRVTVEGEDGDFTAVHNGDDLWAYDGAKNEAYHAEAPEEGPDADKRHKGDKGEALGLPDDLKDATPQELAERVLKTADKSTDVSVAGEAQVAGQRAYELRLTPKQDASTVQDVRIAVDADNGVPLRVTLTADDGTKALDAGFTDVDFGKPDAKLFDFTPPEGAKVTEKDLEDLEDAEPRRGGMPFDGLKAEGLQDAEVHGDGWASVVEFQLPGDALGGDAGQGLLDMFTDKTDAGRTFSSRLVNVLVTDDGKVYAGAVTQDALADAAND